MIEDNLNGLVNYYLDRGYIEEVDRTYFLNRLIDIVGLSQIIHSDIRSDLYTLLDDITGYAIDKKLIENDSFSIDYFQNIITNLFIDKPSTVNKKVVQFGIDYLYNLCVDTNYIKLRSLAKNIKFNGHGVSITINTAKPEKDLKEIALLKTIKSISYPKCPICVENVGFSGNISKSSRINHRTFTLKLNNQLWSFQYSPYLYFDKHCILLDNRHQNMIVNDETIKLQIDFVEKYPDYFIGNNAELPIVGGSILDHNHFQGGVFEFDIDRCDVIDSFYQKGCEVEILDWYLSAIRIKGDKSSVINLCNLYLESWFKYENKEYMIINNEIRHNTINFISRKIGEEFSAIVIFRNNFTNDDYPTGLFHAKPKYHHLKSENIGLIEAMGLAILPGRLVDDIAIIKRKLLGEIIEINPIHQEWYSELSKIKSDNIDELIKDSIAIKFTEILKCCNVFKFASKSKMIAEIKSLVEV